MNAHKMPGVPVLRRFVLQRSAITGEYVFRPRLVEPSAIPSDGEWMDACGLGIVYSATVVRERSPAEAFNLAMVDLAEGVRTTSRVEGVAPGGVKIGMRVRAKLVDDGDASTVVFEPA